MINTILRCVKRNLLSFFTVVNVAICGSLWFLEFTDKHPIQVHLGVAVTGICLTVLVWVIITIVNSNKRLMIESNKDSLTGLPNRVVFKKNLESCIGLSDIHPTRMVAVLIMDLDGFKQINDTLGHPVGDEVLRAVGSRLSAAIRDHDSVCRLGGDEFGLVAVVATMAEAELLCRRIQRIFDTDILVDSHIIEVGISVGVAVFPVHSKKAVDIIRFADIAMYEAKEKRTGYSIYNTSTDTNTLEKLGMTAALRAAISNEQLLLEYQLKRSLSTGKYVGAEALVRWDHPSLGILGPDRFIGIAEDSGSINKLTDWVLKRAIDDFCAIRAKGFDLSTVSINISPYCVTHGEILMSTTSALADKPISASNLVFEVTETSIKHKPEHMLKILVCLDMLGITLSIDDFGTGQSSLTYLRNLPIKEIKIDKSFVLNLIESSQDRLIVQSTIDLAHKVECLVVAEGVETQAIEDALKVMGCDIVQGYHISRPLRLDALLEKLENDREL